MGSELYILLSIFGLFVFSCICFTCCCNCFGERRRRNVNTTTNDTCLYCYGWPDYGHGGCCSPSPATHTTVATGDCEATDAAASHNHGFCFGCCGDDGGCCADQEGCCGGNGNNDTGGCCDGGEGGGFCDGGGGDTGGCCDGDGGGGDTAGCCDGGGGDAGGCDGGGGGCDCDCSSW